MLEVQSLYKPSSPQQPTVKRRRLRLSSVPLVDLRSTSLPGTNTECEEAESRLGSNSSSIALDPLANRLLSKSGICSAEPEGMDGQKAGTSSVRIQHLTNSSWEGKSRFPKLDECAHFHYEYVELGSLQFSLYDESQENWKTLANGDQERGDHHVIQVTSGGKTWLVRRSYENFRLLDEQLHRCIYDRKFSNLKELPLEDSFSEDDTQDAIRSFLSEYLDRFSTLAGNLINCGPVLNWLELDNRGHRLIVTDDSAINTPAVAAAYVIKRYTAQASDEISFEVGDMISVIDMPPPEESIWWRGKKGFEVGFFPCECVEVIGDKVPQSINIPKAPTKPILRKHGKLISFFRSFILSRPSRRKLKQSGILKERVFGCDLGEHLLNSGHDIPMVLKCCAEFIEEHGIVDGIYRLSGITSNIQKLRNAFDEDRVPNLKDDAIVQDIHCVASLLKMYFRELPNPLLTYQLYDKFVGAVQSDDTLRLINMRDVVQQLPPPHYRTLEYLIKHLAKVASHGAGTGMTPKNVAIVWAPNLLRSKELEIGSVAALQVVSVQAIVTEYLIRYVDLIFNDKLPIFPTISSCSTGTPKKSRPKSLAISTPTKLLSLEEARLRALTAGVQAQPKYIEVGGGPSSLPNKYHTIIELPDRRRGSTKLKKSPSGWKSFFSKGKTQVHGGSGKDKPKIHRKASTPISIGHGSGIPGMEKALTEVDVAHPHGKRLRSVKSAESLISTGGSNSNRNSHLLDPNILFSDKLATVSISQDELDNLTSSSLPLPQTMKIAMQGSASNKVSPHTHVRSISHDSYFEVSPENALGGEGEDQESSTADSEIYRDQASSQLVLEDFQDVAVDMNHIHISYDTDLDFLSTGTDEIAAADDEDKEECNDGPAGIPSHASSESGGTPQRSPGKHHQRKTDQGMALKSKLSLKDKFRQAFTSPPSTRKAGASDVTISASESTTDDLSIKGSLKRTPSKIREKIFQALSPESSRRKQQQQQLLSGVENPVLDEESRAEKMESIPLIAPRKSETSSPYQSPKTKHRRWTDNQEEETTCSEQVNEPIVKEETGKSVEQMSPVSRTSTKTTKPSSGTVVERYGSEKTVIVEVHATQGSSDEDEGNSSKEAVEELPTPTQLLTPSAATTTIPTGSIWSEGSAGEAVDLSQSPVSCQSSALGEYGSPSSAGATISDNETLSAGAFESSEAQDDDVFEPIYDPQTTDCLSFDLSLEKDNYGSSETSGHQEYDLDDSLQRLLSRECKVFPDLTLEVRSVLDQDRHASEHGIPRVAVVVTPLVEIQSASTSQEDSGLVETSERIKYILPIGSSVLSETAKHPPSPSTRLTPTTPDTSFLSPTSPGQRFESDSSTPSGATSGEGPGGAMCDSEENMFGYSVLIDESEGCGDESTPDQHEIPFSLHLGDLLSKPGFEKFDKKNENIAEHDSSEGLLAATSEDQILVCGIGSPSSDSEHNAAEATFSKWEESIAAPVDDSKNNYFATADDLCEKPHIDTDFSSLLEFLSMPPKRNDMQEEIENKLKTKATTKGHVDRMSWSLDSAQLQEHDRLLSTDQWCGLSNEKLSTEPLRLSPMDDSKRRFESEIGRNILHERKIKLELEKIQLEHQKGEGRISILDIDPRPSPLPSPLDFNSSLFLQEMNQSYNYNSTSLADTVPNLASARHSIGTQENTSLAGDLAGVELRRPLGLRSDESFSGDEQKRNSEPVPLSCDMAEIDSDPKRHSEPQSLGFMPRCLRPEKKASVKELMSKFEVRSASSSEEHGPPTPTSPCETFIHSSCSLQKPPLFAKPKLSAKPLGGTGDITPTAIPSQAMKNNPDVGVGVNCDSSGESQTVQWQYFDTDTKAKVPNSPVPVVPSKPSVTLPVAHKLEIITPNKESTSSIAITSNSELSGSKTVTVVCKDSVSLRLSCSLDDQAFNSRKGEEVDDASSKDILALISSTDLSDSARRERIDRYKEERRAQLRERIRPESFRGEDKNEYLSRLKQKATSPTQSDMDEGLGSGSSRRNRVKSTTSLSSPSEGDKDWVPRSPRRARANTMGDNRSPSNKDDQLSIAIQTPPKSPKKGSRDASSIKNGIREEVGLPPRPGRTKWPPQPSGGQEKNDEDNGGAGQRGILVRRSLRSSDSRRDPSPEKTPLVLQRRGSLQGSSENRPPSINQPPSSPSRPRDLPLRDRKTPRSPTKLLPSPSKDRKELVRSPRSPSAANSGQPSKPPPVPKDGTSRKSPPEVTLRNSPPRRAIREVAALFEATSSTSSSARVRSSPLPSHHSAIRVQRHLSQGSDDGSSEPALGEGLRKKPSQYLSAV